MLESMKPSAKKSASLEERIAERIARKRGDVFMREDFRDLGSSAQIGRALRALIRKERLLRFGYGIYVRAEPSPLDGKPAPVKTIRELATEALALARRRGHRIPRGTRIQFRAERTSADRPRDCNPRQADTRASSAIAGGS